MILAIALIIVSSCLFYQDANERKVYWFWFPTLTVIYSLIHLGKVEPLVFLYSLALNFFVVGFFFLIIYVYAKYRLKVPSKSVFGLGDALLFLTVAFSFSTVAFIVIFVFSLVFALAAHTITAKNERFTTVPLAGYMSLFFAMSYMAEWFNLIDFLYLI